MRILLSNDDGINAYGLTILEKAVQSLTTDVWVVAPEFDQSGAGHSLTLHNPLRVRQVAEKKYAVNGTPTDCIMYAINHLLKDNPPGFVFSGVNLGANLAEDVTYSGTVAAAMEACLFRIPACAISLVEQDKKARWETVKEHLPGLVKKIIDVRTRQSVFLNVNFPDVDPQDIQGIRVTHQGKRDFKGALHERFDPRGRKYYWVGAVNTQGVPSSGSDLEATTQGFISITPLTIDMTDEKTKEELNHVFI